MRTAAERLIAAREAAGCETAAEGANRAGVKYYTYVQHESGVRGISKDKAQVYGRAFGIEPSWLLYGRGKDRAAMVPIIGRVGADAEGTIFYASGQETGDMAPVPPGGTADSVALEVSGHSMRGLADDGALIFFESQRNPPSADMLGYPVVVETRDGRVLLKRLLKGSRAGVYDLESVNGPTLPDVALVWAAEITAIIPPRQAKRIILRRGEAA